jgi:hypothetical protein
LKLANGPDSKAPNVTRFYDSGAILVADSPNCDVHGNTVTGVHGVGMLEQNRTDDCEFRGGPNYPEGTPVCPGGFHQTHDTYFHDNTITETGVAERGGEVAGLDEDIHDSSFFTSKNNRFVHNTYHLPNLSGAYFSWFDRFIDKDQWIAAGQAKHIGYSQGKAGGPAPAYRDTSLPIEKRVDDLVSRMTLEEKVRQMQKEAPAIRRALECRFSPC